MVKAKKTLKERVQNHPIVIAISVFGGFLTFSIGLGANITNVKDFFLNTVLEKETLAKKVATLAPEEHIGVYKHVLGEPTIINHNEKNRTKEYVFVNKYFYVDSVTDNDDKVIYFAITTRDASFNPVFTSPGYPKNIPSFTITLGKTTFSDLKNDNANLPEFITGCAGAHNVGYYETHYLGNPGDYEDFGFGDNESGYVTNRDLLYSSLPSTLPFCDGTTDISDEKLQQIKELRATEAINTYAVAAPYLSIKDYTSNTLGVNNDQVRILK